MIASAFALAALAAVPADLPAGWHPLPAAALTGEWRDESPVRFARLVADFNGDGHEDLAILLRSSRNEALWVRLGNGPGAAVWQKLAELPDGVTDDPSTMGVQRVAPGVVPYGCFDGAGDCNFGPDAQRPKLVLTSPAIDFFRMGSSASVFFWSNSRRTFLRVWTSD
jgi:hypothetical protein